MGTNGLVIYQRHLVPFIFLDNSLPGLKLSFMSQVTLLLCGNKSSSSQYNLFWELFPSFAFLFYYVHNFKAVQYIVNPPQFTLSDRTEIVLKPWIHSGQGRKRLTKPLSLTRQGTKGNESMAPFVSKYFQSSLEILKDTILWKGMSPKQYRDNLVALLSDTKTSLAHEHSRLNILWLGRSCKRHSVNLHPVVLG